MYQLQIAVAQSSIESDWESLIDIINTNYFRGWDQKKNRRKKISTKTFEKFGEIILQRNFIDKHLPSTLFQRQKEDT